MAREQKTKSKAKPKSKQEQGEVSKQGDAYPPLQQDTESADKADLSGDLASPSSVEQIATSDQQAIWRVQPSWPSWPSSKPGPRSTPPAPGTRSINPLRSEQFEEVGYNQQTGEPATQHPLRSLPDERRTGPTSFDQPTAQDTVGKRKQRL